MSTVSKEYPRLFAELIGTMLLVATVVGSGIMAQNLSDDIGVQLTMNMLATVFVLFLLISMLGPISGAHFNPAVSFIFLITRGIGLGMFFLYVLAQLIGGFLGSVIANAMFDIPTVISSRDRLDAGAPLSEIIATAGLILTILLLIKHNRDLVAVGVATWIGAAYIFTSSTSFANPAVTFGRIFSESFAGIEPVSAAVFTLWQLLGALVGFGIYKILERETNG
ncbi:MAG: aquaporin [Microbacteriaceae bacterium]|nr:aquaporin [Microbacteriaceae bacterium]MDR9444455.1 aquaporin [Microbacteriaceae bacterium]